MTGRLKVLFYAPILEYPPAGGPQLSVVNAVKVLHRISELHILTTIPPDRLGSKGAKEFFQSHSYGLVHLPSSGFRATQPLADRVLRKARRVFAPAIARRDVAFVIEYAARNGIDLFWIDRVFEHAFAVFSELRRRLPFAVIVGDTCSVFSRFILREVPLITNPVRRSWVILKGRRKERQERRLVQSANVVTAVSALDANYFRSIAREPERVKLFSNIVDLDDYRDDGKPRAPLKGRPLLLLGSFGHQNSPMDRAAKWMAEDVMPIVWREIPDAHLYVIGRNADKTQGTRAGESITVVGQVPSVVPYLRGAAATLVPLRFESGTRFKILESGAASVPCISTTLGAEGIGVTHNENILIADTAETFAAAIVKVLGDPDFAEMLGRNLHSLIEAKYSLETQTREGSAIIQYLGEGRIARIGQ